MSSCGKQSLAGLHRKNKKFTEKDTKFFFKQILGAIAYCHGKGVCHRDIKAANIFMKGKRAKIADFGLSKFYK